MVNIMHDIWNPWHGCHKISPGCKNCYMMFLDKIHQNKESTIVYKTKSFDYPLTKTKDGSYKIKSGEIIRVCMNSDFFVEEADEWRSEAWKIIDIRKDVIFMLITKRPERINDCLPKNWKDGYENVILFVTAENQEMIDRRLPILKELPFKHKGVMVAPILESVTIEKYLKDGFIEQVVCGGENYGGNRPCNFDWICNLSNECKKYNITFVFTETGNSFIKDNKLYKIPNKVIQSKMAYRSNQSFKGKEVNYILYNAYGYEIPKEELYVPKYTSINCAECGNKMICNGCSNCGKCPQIKSCVNIFSSK